MLLVAGDDCAVIVALGWAPVMPVTNRIVDVQYSYAHYGRVHDSQSAYAIYYVMFQMMLCMVQGAAGV